MTWLTYTTSGREPIHCAKCDVCGYEEPFDEWCLSVGFPPENWDTFAEGNVLLFECEFCQSGQDLFGGLTLLDQVEVNS